VMDCARVFDASSALARHWKGRLFHAVGKLKHDPQHGTKYKRGHQVVEQYDVRGVKQQRNAERRGEEDRFTDQENDQVPLLGARDSMFADPPSDELSKIIELPLDCQQSIQWPEVKVLPPVKHEPLLMRRQPGEHAEVDVGIMARDIDIGVMEDACFQCQRYEQPVREGRLRLLPLRLLPSLGTPPCR